jgi:nuclear pore complex protein Nup93
MLDSLEREWDAEKASLAAGLGPISAFGGAAAALAAATPGAGAAARAAAGAAAPFVPARGGVGGAAAAAAAERDATYFDVVKAINDARLGAGPPLDAAARFGAAAVAAAGGAGAAGGAAGGATLPELWRALSSVLSRGGAEGALVEGSLRHLADGHKRFMEATVARASTAAALGGSAAPLALVHAFLRAKLHGTGPLDFDGAPPGGGGVVDTAWQVVYYCLRSGFVDEAAAAAQHAAAARGVGRDIAAALVMLANSARGGGGPGGAAAAEAAARAADDAARALHEAPPRAGRAFRAALGAALCGDARVGDAVHAACPELFGTIEDFLWHKLALVRAGASAAAASASLPGTPATPGAPAAASALVPYTLADLQAYLARFEPAHYAKGGREPLLAATVLVLSLRFAAALSFLAEDPLAEGYAIDGVHVAAALTASGALRGAGGERGADVAGAAARLLASYGRQLAAPAPARAAEYFALAAEAAASAARAAAPSARGPGAAAIEPGTAADATAVLEALLRELLRHPGAATPLLGASGCDGGALARFVHDGSRRRDLVNVAASECRAAALIEQAMELHTRAEEPGAALELLNGKLADALTAAAVAPNAVAAAAATAACEALLSRGAELAAAARGERVQTVAFAALRVVEALLRDARAGKHGDVLSRWRDSPELRFVPIDPFRAQRAAAELDGLHPGVAARLPDVLLACAAALAAPGAERVLGSDADVQAAKAALTTLAGAARFHIPPHVYGQLARLTTAPMQS